MSKMIKMTPEALQEAREAFEEALRNVKMSDGKLAFAKSFELPDKKATLYYTPAAWFKMCNLLDTFSQEVAWHGVAERVEGEEYAYLVTDIVVYPQVVSGATVEMDETEYSNWLMNNMEAPWFGNLHMQGHSHVNMATSPSQTDIDHQNEILAQLPEDGFYIFVIYNKSLSHTDKIFDLRENILFESKDITTKLKLDGVDMEAFLKESKEIVKTKTYQYITPTYQNQPAKQTTPPAKTIEPVSTPAKTQPKRDFERPKFNAADYQGGYDAYGDYDDGYGGAWRGYY